MRPLACLFVALGSWQRKGLPLILNAVSRVDGTAPTRCILNILGRPGIGEEGILSAYRPLIERGCVNLCGYRADVSGAYESSDVLIVGSYYETCSLVMLDALRYGLAILCTPVHGVDSMVQPGVNGFVVQRDPEDLARRIVQLAGDPDLLQSMKLNSRSLAHRFSPATIAAATEQVYLRVAR